MIKDNDTVIIGVDKDSGNNIATIEYNKINLVFDRYLKFVILPSFTTSTDLNELTIFLHHSHLFVFSYLVKYNSLKLLNSCIDLVIYDRPSKNNRFTFIYLLLSTVYNTRTRIITQVNELQSVLSLHLLFASLNWSEREGWDIFGVFFINHTSLRRILTDYGFKGHPLRKDFPLTGFYELNYNDTKQQILYSTIKLTQEFRLFSIDFFKKRWF